MSLVNVHDALSDIVEDCGDGPELTGGIVYRLAMIQRGKHYSQTGERVALRDIAEEMRELADRIENIADGVPS